MISAKLWTKKILGFLLGARFLATAVLTFALYISTFFIFNTSEDLHHFVFDFKVHVIIFCGVLSILSGGIINQFYDKEKDKFVRPFRSWLESFIQQRTFLYAYLGMSLISLCISSFISLRVFVFYLVYQILIWAYSHKFSRIFILNNLLFVGLTLYPFFGMVIYFEAYNSTVFLLATYLFLLLLIIDMLKDILTRKADTALGYHTIATDFGISISRIAVSIIVIVASIISFLLGNHLGNHRILYWYFIFGIPVLYSLSILLSKISNWRIMLMINLLKIWIFIGILWIAADGIFTK